MHRLLARRLAALVLTTLVAVSLGHLMFTVSLGGVPFFEALAGVPAYLADLVRGELGDTPGIKCSPVQIGHIDQCGSWGPQQVAEMLRQRFPIDVQLIVGGTALGTAAGVATGRWCAVHPRSWGTRALHAAIAFLLSCPPYFLAFIVLVWFSWNTGDYKLPFVSGQGDYQAFGEDPLAFVKSMWVPWVVVALPLAAFVARITEASLRDVLHEDFVRTARAKGLSDARVINLHALPLATPPIAAMTGVNVSTMLINAAAIEYGYAIPGMFRTIRGAVVEQDLAVLQALVLEGVILVVIANFLVDAIQARLDPRVRAG